MLKRVYLICMLMPLLALVAVACGASETRGLWVDAFHPGIMNSAQTTEMVAKAKDAGFNAVFVQVRKRGDALYTSTIEPRADGIAAAYDPLADVIEKAHADGLEVHAWVSTLDVFADDPAYEFKTRDNVVAKHPDWLMKTKEGSTTLQQKKVMLDPGVPEARKYTVGIPAFSSGLPNTSWLIWL